MKRFLLIASLILSVFGNAQAPAIQWAKCYGGTADDLANSIQQCKDKGFIITGSTKSNNFNVTNNNGQTDGWVVKIDSNGVLQWQKAFGGSNNDAFRSVQQTYDNGYILVGSSSSNDGNVTGHHGVINNGNGDYWIVKIDSMGQLIWQKSLGGSNNDIAMKVALTSDSGFIITGFSNSIDYDITNNKGGYDFWVVKLSKTGIMQWQKSYGGSLDENGYGVKQTFDGGYILCGQTSSSNGDVFNHKGNNDFWVLKIDNIGSIVWSNCYGGSYKEIAEDVIQTKDSGYIVCGWTASNDSDLLNIHNGVVGDVDYWIVKLSKFGVIEWQKCYGGTDADYSEQIKQTIDGGYIVIGTSKSNNGNVSNNYGYDDVWIVKISNTGNIEWQNNYGGSSFESGMPSIFQTDNKGYVFAAATYSNNFNVSGNHGGYDYWVVKLAPDPLPLKLLSFTAQKESNNVLLNWQTANEVNVSHINIQRSSNSNDFATIGNVNASCCAYSFTDNKLPITNDKLTLNYRLEIVDKDGSKTYSEIKQIRLNELSNQPINVFPNPAKDFVTIESRGAKHLTITDCVGRIIQQLNIVSEHQTINTKQWSKGIYMLSFDTGEKIKLVKE